jgi:glutamyl/glutaminyl-tRNA synthetase
MSGDAPSTPFRGHSDYRGRLAPSPTGYLHLGHARTFWTAQQRARENQGTLILRNEDLDRARCRTEFVTAMIEDLQWFGFAWQEGPDCGGPFAPYSQSERIPLYRRALRQLIDGGHVYPCLCSRRDIERAVQAPHENEEGPVYPGTCRADSRREWKVRLSDDPLFPELPANSQRPFAWRFRVPDGEKVSFADGGFGPHSFEAGRDFGDFVVWRPDGLPSYQLAVVIDDAAMRITEVVRGADLLISTARQVLLYRTLGLPSPQFYHCPLITDEAGVRLAKRHDALSLRKLRETGTSAETLRRGWV